MATRLNRHSAADGQSLDRARRRRGCTAAGSIPSIVACSCKACVHVRGARSFSRHSSREPSGASFAKLRAPVSGKRRSRRLSCTHTVQYGDERLHLLVCREHRAEANSILIPSSVSASWRTDQRLVNRITVPLGHEPSRGSVACGRIEGTAIERYLRPVTACEYSERVRGLILNMQQLGSDAATVVEAGQGERVGPRGSEPCSARVSAGVLSVSVCTLYGRRESSRCSRVLLSRRVRSRVTWQCTRGGLGSESGGDLGLGAIPPRESSTRHTRTQRHGKDVEPDSFPTCTR